VEEKLSKMQLLEKLIQVVFQHETVIQQNRIEMLSQNRNPLK